MFGVLGVVARCAVVWLYRHHPLVGDQAFYVQSARSKGLGVWPPDFTRAPLYPAVLGLFIRLKSGLGLGGDLRIWIGIAQTALCVASSVLLGLAIGRRFTRAVGMWTFGILMLIPNFVFMANLPMEEQLFIPLLMVGIATLLWQPEPTRVQLVLSGVSFGLAGLTRSVGVVCWLALVLALALGVYKPLGGRWRSALVVFVAGLAVLSPWMILGAVRTGSPILVDATSGQNLCIGNSRAATGSWVLTDCGVSGAGVSPAVESRRRSARAFRWAEHHVGREATLLRRRWDALICCDSSALDYRDPASPAMRHWRTFNYYGWLGLSILASVGLLLGWREKILRLCVALWLGLLAPVMITFGIDRFHTPWYPLMAISGGYGIVHVTEWARRMRDQLARRVERVRAASTRPRGTERNRATPKLMSRLFSRASSIRFAITVLPSLSRRMIVTCDEPQPLGTLTDLHDLYS